MSSLVVLALGSAPHWMVYSLRWVEFLPLTIGTIWFYYLFLHYWSVHCKFQMVGMTLPQQASFLSSQYTSAVLSRQQFLQEPTWTLDRNFVSVPVDPLEIDRGHLGDQSSTSDLLVAPPPDSQCWVLEGPTVFSSSGK